jgi:hypothetical protein
MNMFLLDLFWLWWFNEIYGWIMYVWCLLIRMPCLIWCSGHFDFFDWMGVMKLHCCCSNPNYFQKVWFSRVACLLLLFYWHGPIRTFRSLAPVRRVLVIACEIYKNATDQHFDLLNHVYFVHLFQIDTSSSKNHNSLILIPKFMKIFALCSAWCLVFYHDFCWFFGWSNF